MIFYKIITYCVLWAIFVDFIDSLPTFGDEFVHIKVHVPKDPSSSHGILQSKQESVSSQHQHTGHKVIHHFHRRRRPIKKVPKIEADPLFENALLAELDNPSNEHSYRPEAKNKVLPPIDETYVIKEAHYDMPALDKVNTFTAIEDTLTKPKYKQYKESYLGYGNGNIETYKIIGEHKAEKHHHPKHVETIKLIEEKPHYQYQQHIAKDEYEYHKPQEEINKFIEKFIYKTSYEPQEMEKTEEQDEYFYPDQHIGDAHYEYYEPQHQEPLEIVKTKFSNAKGYSRPYQDSIFEVSHHQHYHPKLVQETTEILKTKNPKKYQYETEFDYDYNHESKNHYNYHQPQEEIVQTKEIKCSKPEEDYYYYRETPNNSYHQGEDYRHLSNQSPTKSHYFGTIGNYETGYRYHTPSTSLHQSSASAEIKPQYKPSSSYSQFEETLNYDDFSNLKANKYSDDLQQLLPSTESPTEFRNPYNYQAVDARASETYTGYDSYSAAHVQGLGSGGYKLPSAYSEFM